MDGMDSNLIGRIGLSVVMWVVYIHKYPEPRSYVTVG